MDTTRILAVATTACLLATAGASAATVTTLDGSQGWVSYDTRGGATSAITTDQPRNGNGSVKFQTNNDLEKATVGTFDTTGGQFGTLGDLVAGSISMDYYRDSSSTTTSTQAPSLNLFVKNPNGVTGTLIWERVYTHDTGTDRDTPTDQWIDNEAIGSENFYIRSNPGTGTTSYDQGGNYKPLSFFANGSTVSNGTSTSLALGSDTVITGIGIGVGSGLGPVYLGYVDDVNVNFGNGGGSISANFEAAAVPEPTTLLGGLALGGMTVLGRRRKLLA